ncbi:succinate dehydrogenase/fumarate reductase iron-sulfur subunit [Acidobacteriota bacterium]
MAKDSLKFKIFRFDPKDAQGPRFDTFDVPYTPGLTVLMGLIYIQEFLDGSLAFRSSCRAGVCGSCGMHINGQYRLACETQAKDFLGGKITIRPLSHLPIYRDLVVDMSGFWDKYKTIKPYLIPGETAPEGRERYQTPDERARIDGVIDCILCACCHASCPMTETDEQYLGPAVLTKAARFLLDTRDSGTGERLVISGDEHGVWRCHTVYNCVKVCPKEIDPTGAIAELKKEAIRWKVLGKEKSIS